MAKIATEGNKDGSRIVPMKDNTSSTVYTETRRLAAIMFTDIVGFRRFLEKRVPKSEPLR